MKAKPTTLKVNNIMEKQEKISMLVEHSSMMLKVTLKKPIAILDKQILISIKPDNMKLDQHKLLLQLDWVNQT